MVRELQSELDSIIQVGVRNIVQLVHNQDNQSKGIVVEGSEGLGMQDGEDLEFVMKTRKQRSRERKPLQRGQEQSQKQAKEAKAENKVGKD